MRIHLIMRHSFFSMSLVYPWCSSEEPLQFVGRGGFYGKPICSNLDEVSNAVSLADPILSIHTQGKPQCAQSARTSDSLQTPIWSLAHQATGDKQS